MLANLRNRLDTVIEPLAYAGLRSLCGIWLIAHGLPKWNMGIATFAANSLARRGFEPALPLAYMVVGIELVLGALITLGLLTRLSAFISAGHLAFITFFVVWPNGFPWTRPGGGGWEYPAMWAALLLFIAIRGGGTWSLDHLIGARRGVAARAG
jgi:putative oxidoreductase